MPDIENTVGEIAAKFPCAPGVLEKHHIDYGTGGKRPFREACRVAGARAEEVLDEIRREGREDRWSRPGPGWDDGSSENWEREPSAVLIEYLVATHRRWREQDLPMIDALLDRVEAVQRTNHGVHVTGVAQLRRVFDRLRHRLEEHLRQEENILFPAILAMEASDAGGRPLPRLAFGSVKNPITMMERDHETDAGLWDEIRDLTYGYAVAEDAPESTRRLFRELQSLETATHEHTHLESNILFPRVKRLEEQRGRR